MATPNYIALRDRIRSWANRDEEVLSNAIIRDCIQFGADKAYRTLQIPAIEKTYSYVVNAGISEWDTEPDYQDWIDNNYIPVPPDLTRFVYVRKVSGNGVFTYSTSTTDLPGVVLTTKIHSRSYADPSFIIEDDKYFAVREDKILIPKSLAVTDGDVFEVVYYGRLSEMDEEYDVSDENYAQGIYASAPTSNWTGSIYNSSQTITTPYENAIYEGFDPEDETTWPTTAATDKSLFDDYIDLQGLVAAGGAKPTENLSASWIYSEGTHSDPEGDVVLTDTWTDADLQRWWNVHGIEVPNWLRDEQQKVILYGALMEVAKYLGDQEMYARFAAEFEDEVRLLNLEEQFRITSGANATQGFQGHGLI